MKLAQALQERADLNKKISQLEYRLSMNAVIQEGEDSLESPKELLKELNTSYDNLETLISRINLTNCNTKTEYNNSTLTELIAKIGENIVIRRFARFERGEGIEKEEVDFAEEVMKQVKGN